MPFFQYEGRAVYYEESGKGEPFLYLHGWNESSHSFRESIAPLLDDHYKVLTLDLPGFGKSDFFNISYASITRLISAFLKYMDMQEITLAGFCLGGTFALDYAIVYPQSVTKLFLLDVTLEYPLSLNAPFTPKIGRQILRFFLKTKVGNRITSKQLQSKHSPKRDFFNSFKDTDIDVSYHYLDVVRDYSRLDHYIRVKEAIPFNIVCVEGEYSSRYVKESMRRIVTLLPNANHIQIEKAGHFFPEERPRDVVTIFKGTPL